MKALILLVSLISSSFAFASLIPPNYCEGKGRVVVEQNLKEVVPGNSCFYNSARCVDEKICPEYGQIPANFCEGKGRLVITNKLKKVADKSYCYAPKAHCVNDQKCAQYALFGQLPPNYCEGKGRLVITSELIKVGEYSCHFSKATCVDEKLCPMF